MADPALASSNSKTQLTATPEWPSSAACVLLPPCLQEAVEDHVARARWQHLRVQERSQFEWQSLGDASQALRMAGIEVLRLMFHALQATPEWAPDDYDIHILLDAMALFDCIFIPKRVDPQDVRCLAAACLTVVAKFHGTYPAQQVDLQALVRQPQFHATPAMAAAVADLPITRRVKPQDVCQWEISLLSWVDWQPLRCHAVTVLRAWSALSPWTVKGEWHVSRAGRPRRLTRSGQAHDQVQAVLAAAALAAAPCYALHQFLPSTRAAALLAVARRACGMRVPWPLQFRKLFGVAWDDDLEAAVRTVEREVLQHVPHGVHGTRPHPFTPPRQQDAVPVAKAAPSSHSPACVASASMAPDSGHSWWYSWWRALIGDRLAACTIV